MKPDGVTMDTTDATEVAAVAEPGLLQENITEQTPSQPETTADDGARGDAPKANGKPLTDAKVKPKTFGHKTKPTASVGTSGSNSRPGTAAQRTANDVRPAGAASAGKRAGTNAASKPSTAGAVPKRPVGVAAVSSAAKNQTRAPDRRPAGPARTASAPAAAVTNGTKPTAANGASNKRPTTETDNGARPRTTAVANRTATSSAPKPGSSTTTKPAASKTTRPAPGPSTSRPASAASRPATAAAAKPAAPRVATAPPAAPRVATAPPAGRPAVTQSPKAAAAAKKDVSRPPSVAMPRRPTTTATGSPAAKKHEPSKPVAAARVTSAPKVSTVTKAADTKTSHSKPQQPEKPAPTKKPTSSVRIPPSSKPPLGRAPPASPANKPAKSASNLKRGAKPTQSVPPFNATKKTEVSNAAVPAAASAATRADVAAETSSEAAAATLQEVSPPTPGPVEVPSQIPTSDPTAEVSPGEAAPPPPQSPVKPTLPQTSVLKEQLENDTPPSVVQEQTFSDAKSTLAPVGAPPDLPEDTSHPLPDKTPSTSTANAVPQMVPPPNLNDVEDEEEREGSQLVSVSEMSGTTQPTEESRPESCGQVGASAWKASGALLSELDSEEVSGSQQGASELSAPGVLEGTESMDDLGDGSLKGAIDMEGASAGSPDFEKVPDIPVNDFDEDEDDSDRVCDMDVGSERTDEPRRPRHDNDVDEEEDEDEDVEMASEGVTESGLESYGNADEDDFADDERLDNLNRVVQPPPPPALPSAPAAQWDQPNPFMDPWAEPPQSQQVLAAAARPMTDPWQSGTPTRTPAQAWFQLGSGPDKPDVPHPSSVKDEPQNAESSRGPVQTLAPPGTSQSSTLSSETSSPEEPALHDAALQPPAARASVRSPQNPQGPEEEEEEDEAEPETLPADEVLGGPATAPTSNPSSSSVTEDEASDTEGEAQLEDSLESPVLGNITFVSQAPPQRCLSTVEEGEEAETVEGGAVEDTTPPSAASLASYGFDTATTASTSNPQSAGESCTKSPGIFSLEELPEEAKELQVQQYIECGKQEAESAEPVGEDVSAPGPDGSSPLNAEQQPEGRSDDVQPPYYSAICEKTEESFADPAAAAPPPHRHDHLPYPRTYYDTVQLPGGPPRLSCADLPPRRSPARPALSPAQPALSPQLRRLEQHQRQLLELQQRREQQSRPLEEAEQERKRRVEEEERRKKEEAEEEIKRNKEEERKKEEEAEEERMKEEAEEERKKEEAEEERKKEEAEEERTRRRELELQLQQQQQELKQRQQELEQSSKGPAAALLSPSSGLCTIYEALENSDDEAEGEDTPETPDRDDGRQKTGSDEDGHEDSSLSVSPSPLPDSAQSSSSQDEDGSSSCPPGSPEKPPPVDLDWGKKVDIVQQLINQTLLLNGDGCSSLLLLPGGAGGTLSPLESSLWPSLLPPLTPPSATVTSVSSFSPEASGSSPQGEWTVVELETHH